MRLNLLLFLPVIVLFASCNVINKPEKTPTYIQIDSFNLKVNDPTKEGSASGAITAVWIYYNNNPVGIFDLPCNVPVITEGEKGTISLAPAITLNGLKDLQPIYPFYSFDTSAFISSPGKAIHFNPQTSYWPTVKFPYKEDFEVGNSFVDFEPGLTTDSSIARSSAADKVFEGGGSGMINLDTQHPLSESISNTGFSIPAGEAYIEVNYKCNVPFIFGLYNTLTSQVDVFEYLQIGVKPSDTWKKIYFELGTYTQKYPGKNYKVLIKATLPEGQANGYVLLDNIKVVTF